jgi:hypothetical protein
MFSRGINNLEYTVDSNGMLVFTIDPSKNLGLSATGKNTMMASSKGNQAIQLPDGRTVNVGINIYYK